MKFHVGPNTYTLVISNRSIFNDEGDELEGIAVEHRRLLIVSHRVEPERREDVVLHELKHAWQFHVPKPTTDEEDSQLFALVAKQFRIDLESAGGVEAIRQLTPTTVPHLGRPADRPARRIVPALEIGVMMRPDRVPCGGCDADVMCGSIVNSAPVFHEPSQQHRMERWFQCDACGVIQAWTELADADGTPLGQLVANPPPKLLRGAEASAWIAEHAQLA